MKFAHDEKAQARNSIRVKGQKVVENRQKLLEQKMEKCKLEGLI